MYIKLNFTAAKPAYQVFRTLNQIINTSGITSISALTTAASSGTWDATLTSSLDTANSEIIRTTDLTYTKSHMSATPSTKLYTFTIEHSVYDNTAKKFYTQFTNATSATLQILHQMGTTLAGGTITSSMITPQTTDATATLTGTALTIGGVTTGVASTLAAAGTGGDDIFTFWMYITDTCMIWAINNNAAAPVGWPGTYSAATALSGPYVMSQYTRDDYWNTDSLGYYPVALFSFRGAGIGMGSGVDNSTSIVNPLYATADTSYTPLRVLNLVDTSPSVATTAPTVRTNQPVAITLDGISAAHRGLAAESNVTTAGTISYRAVVNTVNAQYKIPDATFTVAVYGHHDIGWEMSQYACFGGSLSQKGNFYWFNGDYTPGDEYSISTTTYSIWPMWSGSAARCGLSIPKT